MPKADDEPPTAAVPQAPVPERSDRDRDSDGAELGVAEAGSDEQEAEREDVPAELMMSPRRLLATTLLGLLGLMAVIAVLGVYFRAPLLTLSEAFVELLGGPGIAVGYLIPDAFTVPVPNDAFGVFGIAGGVGFWEVVFWGTLGSVTGGCLGWFIGRRLRGTAVIARFMNGRGRGIETLVRRYGVLVVAVAAVTPLPYSLSAWAAGAVRLPFFTFVAVSMLRVVRVAGTLYFIELGLLSTG